MRLEKEGETDMISATSGHKKQRRQVLAELPQLRE
jgi:hypothetical protein